MRVRIRMNLPRIRFDLRALLTGAVWIAGAAALVFVAFGSAFYLSIQSAGRSNEVQVPELAGLALEQATAAVEPMELRLEVVDQRHDPAVSSGHVLEQMPRAGTKVRRGRKLRLVLSLGGEVLNVPDWVGQASRTVEIELRQEGFVPGDEAHVRTVNTRSGTVIGQVPPPTTPAVPNTRVHRLISDGSPVPTWVMPDLIGLRRSDVEPWIARSGFRRGSVRRVRMAGWPSGTVIGQLPLPGYPVRERDIVELTVAQ